MQKPRKPIGQRIIQACEIVERLGVCGSPEIYPIMDIEQTNCIKYLSRAVGMGLLYVNRDFRPHQYYVMPGWRDKIKPIARVKPYIPRPARKPTPSTNFILQNVWGACENH